MTFFGSATKAALLLFCIALTCQSCGPAKSDQGEQALASAAKYTMRDDQGQSFSFDVFPHRIVSLCLFVDEILLDLVDKQSILSLTALSLDANISNIADSSRGIEHHLGLNVEALLLYKPDLILVAEWSEKDKVDQLRLLGLPVFSVSTPRNFEELRRLIDQLALLTGAHKRSVQVKAAIKTRLERIQASLNQRGLANTVSAMDYTPWSSGFGRGSSWSELLNKAGIKNALQAFPVDSIGQVSLSKEMLLQLDPDLLIIPGWVYGDAQAAKVFLAQIVNDPSLAGLKALKNQRLIQMPERLKSAASQFMVDAVEFLVAHAYPEN